MPALDRVLVLQPRVAAEPGPLGDPVHQQAGGVALHRPAGGDGAGRPVVAGLDGAEEGVGGADREVRVLEQDRAVRLAVEVGLVAGPDQGLRLPLLLGLALDELEDVGCQTFSVCILAARRVLPPDLTTLATAS